MCWRQITGLGLDSDVISLATNHGRLGIHIRLHTLVFKKGLQYILEMLKQDKIKIRC
jgi:hypothetical protein